MLSAYAQRHIFAWHSLYCLIFPLIEEYDEYDKEFDKMREATLKTRGVQAKEELSSATKHVDECRKQLDYAKEQVFVLIFLVQKFSKFSSIN